MGTAKVGADGFVAGMFLIPNNAPKGARLVVIVPQTTDGQPDTLTVATTWESGFLVPALPCPRFCGYLSQEGR